MPRLQPSLLNLRFGRWTVIGPSRRGISPSGKSHAMFWGCRCDCGTEAEVRSKSLKRGESRSCGCMGAGRPRKPQKPSPINYATTTVMHPSIYRLIKKKAANRMLRFYPDVTPEFLQELYDKQKGLCALSGVKLIFAMNAHSARVTTASLDRKDNSKHYTRENVQWVHKDINQMKHAFDQEKFIEMCRAVANTMTW